MGVSGRTSELLRTLAVLAEPPTPQARHLSRLLELGSTAIESEHNDLFLFELYPYGSVYLGPEGMMGGEPRDRFAGFWRALGIDPPAEPDHLSTVLAFYAELAEAEETRTDSRGEVARWQARRAFLWEHLLSWLPLYLAKLDDLADGFYRRWGSLLGETLGAEIELFTASSTLPKELPLHLRLAPALPAPVEGGAAFLDALLAPARTGFILSRSDLARAAGELGLGLRIGARKFILKGLFAQEPATILAWLAAEASRWPGRYRHTTAMPAPIAEFWAARAETTAALLLQAGEEVEEGAL